MLSKCANPICGVPFRNMKDGRVYVAEYYDEGDVCLLAGAPHVAGKRSSRHEMYWLCGTCDRAMVLAVRENKVVTIRRAQVVENDHLLREIRLAG